MQFKVQCSNNSEVYSQGFLLYSWGYTAPWVGFNPTHLGLGWVWVGFWVELQRRKPNPEKTQPINPNPENSGLTQYIQIVMVVFIVVSQSEGEGHFLPSDMAVSHLLIWPFLAFFLAVQQGRFLTF